MRKVKHFVNFFILCFVSKNVLSTFSANHTYIKPSGIVLAMLMFSKKYQLACVLFAYAAGILEIHRAAQGKDTKNKNIPKTKRVNL